MDVGYHYVYLTTVSTIVVVDKEQNNRVATPEVCSIMELPPQRRLVEMMMMITRMSKGCRSSLLMNVRNLTTGSTSSCHKRRRVSVLNSSSYETTLSLSYVGSSNLLKKTFPTVDLCRIYFSTGNQPRESNRVVVGSSGFNKPNDTRSSPSSASSLEEKDRTVQSTTSPSVWQQLQSIPNMITLARMASTPVLCYWIVHEDYTLAMYGCVVAAISDGLDGYMAKHHGGSTVLGTYLDPLADKALVNGLALSLWYTGILPVPLILAWAFKDVVLLSGTAWYLYQDQKTINFFDNSVATKPLTVTPTTLGKANTGLQFATLAIGILTPVTSPETLPPVILQSLCWVTGFTSMGSILSYTGKSGLRTERRDETTK